MHAKTYLQYAQNERRKFACGWSNIVDNLALAVRHGFNDVVSTLSSHLIILCKYKFTRTSIIT